MADITNGTYWNATDSSNSQASPNGFPEGMAPSGLNDSGRAVMGAVKRFHNRMNGAATSTGSSNTYALSYTGAPASYVTGERFMFIPNHSNTGAATLNINTLGAKTIKRLDGSTLLADDILINTFCEVAYNGTDFLLLLPAAVNAADVSGTIANFTSTGIDDNATATKITITDGTTTIGNVAVFSSTDNLELPGGTTGQRPGTPAEKDARYNSTTKAWEFYNGTGWVSLAGSWSAADATAWALGAAGIPFSDSGLTGLSANDVQEAIGDFWTIFTGRTLTAGSGLTGGGNLSDNRSFAVDINGLSADGTPDRAADYVMTYDASAGALKKVLLNNVSAATGAASTSSAGVVELGDATEVRAASSSTLVAALDMLKHHPGVAKFCAFVSVSGSTPTLVSTHSYNVTSISDGGTGILNITIGNDFSDANWVCVATAKGATDPYVCIISQAAGTVQLSCSDDTGNNVDPTSWSVVGYGVLA